ncbi:MAG: shikimate dehydrogenase [Nitrososphaeria archaeon]|nr:shikimate dehydrogenase [Nitrososphaeria archaeon]NIQ33347.1 shikimate dehydrogenase [Nitrososphaeria archaeon]
MSSESRIDGETKLCCLIGKPVHHSISPQIHNEAYQHLGLNYVYVAFEVEEGKLDAAVAGLRALGASGLNVTIPHKTSVIRLLNEVDSEASKIGAVNTVIHRDGQLTGYNTDVDGVEFAFTGSGVSTREKRVAVVGAGGAARAVIASMARSGCVEISCLNRTQERAQRLAKEARKKWNVDVSVAPLNVANLKRYIGEAEIVVNATSLGMHPKVDETPIPKRFITENHTVFDVVYTPIETRFLAEAKERGAKTIGGLDMLVGQALRAFELFTGSKAPQNVMRNAAFSALGVKDEG